MFRLTKKVRDHLASKVLTPISLTVLGALAAQGWTQGNIWVLLYGVFLFLCIQSVAVMLIAYDDGNGANQP